MSLFKKKKQPKWFIFATNAKGDIVYFASQPVHDWDANKGNAHLFSSREDGKVVLELLKQQPTEGITVQFLLADED